MCRASAVVPIVGLVGSVEHEVVSAAADTARCLATASDSAKDELFAAEVRAPPPPLPNLPLVKGLLPPVLGPLASPCSRPLAFAGRLRAF